MRDAEERRVSRWRAGGVVLLVALLAAVPGGARGVPAPPAAVGVWEACDYLDFAAGVSARSGLRVEAGMTQREALSHGSETLLGMRLEPRRGVGAGLRWRRLWLGEGGNADDLEARLLFRRSGLRLAGGAGRLTRGRHRLTRIVLQAHGVMLGAILAGARVRLFPSQAAWAPQVTATFHVAQGPWWAGVELGSEGSELTAAMGLRVRPGLVWTTSWAASGPGMGMAWRWEKTELRAERSSHPYLGAVQRVRLVVGRGRP